MQVVDDARKKNKVSFVGRKRFSEPNVVNRLLVRGEDSLYLPGRVMVVFLFLEKANFSIAQYEGKAGSWDAGCLSK